MAFSDAVFVRTETMFVAPGAFVDVVGMFVRFCVRFVRVVFRSSSKMPESPRERFVEALVSADAAGVLTVNTVTMIANKGPIHLPAFIKKDTPVCCFGEAGSAVLFA